MRKSIYIVVTALFIFTSCRVWAQVKQINIVTTAVPLLRINSDAKGNGMGATGIATAPDASAMEWNVGKVSFSNTAGELTANYSPWLKEWNSDMYIASLGGYHKISEFEAIYGQLKYFRLGDLQFSDNNGNHLQSYRPNEFTINFGYSRKLSKHLGVGAGIKYIRSDLAKGNQNGESFKVGNAAAIDLGVYYDLKKEDNSGWAFGLALSNLGTKISYSNFANEKDYIPANLGIGTSFTKVIDDQNKFTLALDINKLLVITPPSTSDTAALVAYRSKSVVSSWFSSFSDAPDGFKEELKEFQISVGAEYWYNELFALRGGYFYENKYKGDRKYLSAGAGVKYNIFKVNFSYLVPTSKGINKNPLANTLQLGVTMSFEK